MPADLNEWMGIYRTLAQAYHLGQEQVDAMELPVIAELLGVHDPPEADPADVETTTPEEFERKSREIIRARVAAAAAAKAGAFPPEASASARMEG